MSMLLFLSQLLRVGKQKRHRLAVLGEPCSWVGAGTAAGLPLGGRATTPAPPLSRAAAPGRWLGQRWVPGPSCCAPASQEARGRCEMTLTLVSSPIPLALKVLLHVGLVRCERCGVLAECPISIFSSFLLNVCQKTTVITHEQGKFPSSRVSRRVWVCPAMPTEGPPPWLLKPPLRSA